jgi:hypothetical protein
MTDQTLSFVLASSPLSLCAPRPAADADGCLPLTRGATAPRRLLRRRWPLPDPRPIRPPTRRPRSSRRTSTLPRTASSGRVSWRTRRRSTGAASARSAWSCSRRSACHLLPCFRLLLADRLSTSLSNRQERERIARTTTRGKYRELTVEKELIETSSCVGKQLPFPRALRSTSWSLTCALLPCVSQEGGLLRHPLLAYRLPAVSDHGRPPGGRS